MNVFEFVNSITYNKQNLFEDPQAETDYVSFVVNRALSYFPDTVLYANEMNIHNTVPKQWQFEYLRQAIHKRRRYSKWAKKTIDSDDLKVVQTYYKYSTERAVEALQILSKEQIEYLKQLMDTGGT